MPHVLIPPFEQALQVWQDLYFYFFIRSTLQLRLGEEPDVGIGGPLINSINFRQHLGVLSKPSEVRDQKTFELHKYVTQQTLTEQGFFGRLPIPLGYWTAYSHQMFHPDPDLEIMLSATSLGNISFRELTYPLPAFAISLSHPLTDTAGKTYDSLIVLGLRKSEDADTFYCLSLYLFPATLASYQSLTQFERREARDALEKNDRRKLQRFIDLYEEQYAPYLKDRAGIWFDVGLPVNAPIRNTIGQMAGETKNQKSVYFSRIQDTAARIAIGFCLYLQMLPHDANRRESPVRCEYLKPRPAISGIQEYAVHSTKTLTPRAHEVLRRILDAGTSSSLCVQFRRGLWRRRLGQGTDPNTPRAIHVPPSIYPQQ